MQSLGYVGLDLGYLTEKQFTEMSVRCENAKGLINGLIRYLRSRKD